MILELALGATGAAAAYLAGRCIYDDVYKRVMDVRTNRVRLDAMKQRAALQNLTHIPPDENGRGGWVVTADGRITNLDTRAVFDRFETYYLDPMVERLDRMERMMLAARGVGSGTEQLLQPPAQLLPQLPEQISIQDVIGTHTPSLDDLIIGVTLDEDGQLIPVSRSIYDLLHLFAVGITGSGKSTWLLAFLSQIEMCREPIEVILIDVHGSAFNLCSDWSKLRYPIARTNEQAKAVLEAVRIESERRSKLYEAVPLAEDLASYNANAETPLVPWLVVIDEGTLMLADKSISDYVAKCVQGTRQFGLLAFVTGQTANTTSVPSPIRDNFATRLCYTTSSTSMRVALGDTPPGELEEIPGRGWALLRGKKTPIKIQSPYIRRDKLYQMIGHDGPKLPMPEIDIEPMIGDRGQRVRQMYADGHSLRTIEKEVYGYAGGAAHDKVTGILGATIATEE